MTNIVPLNHDTNVVIPLHKRAGYTCSAPSLNQQPFLLVIEHSYFHCSTQINLIPFFGFIAPFRRGTKRHSTDRRFGFQLLPFTTFFCTATQALENELLPIQKKLTNIEAFFEYSPSRKSTHNSGKRYICRINLDI